LDAGKTATGVDFSFTPHHMRFDFIVKAVSTGCKPSTYRRPVTKSGIVVVVEIALASYPATVWATMAEIVAVVKIAFPNV
jgi:hypothetical protein